jgi:hypothetical protein
MAITRLDSKGSAIAYKLALARLSEDLVTDRAAREQFIADPVLWVRTTYKVEPSDKDREFLEGYRQLYAIGSCCPPGCCHKE